MLVDRDHGDWYECCLQCGYRHELTSVVNVRPQDRVITNIHKQFDSVPYLPKR